MNSAMMLRLLLLLFLFLTLPVQAQTGPEQHAPSFPELAEQPQIRFERLGLEDGLSQGNILDIIQERGAA